MSVVKSGSTYYLYGEDEYYPSGQTCTTVHLLTSPNGVDWTERGTVLQTTGSWLGLRPF